MNFPRVDMKLTVLAAALLAANAVQAQQTMCPATVPGGPLVNCAQPIGPSKPADPTYLPAPGVYPYAGGVLASDDYTVMNATVPANKQFQEWRQERSISL